MAIICNIKMCPLFFLRSSACLDHLGMDRYNVKATCYRDVIISLKIEMFVTC